MKTLKNYIFVTLPTILIVLIILEIVFRIVIPASDPPRAFFNEKEKMYCLSNKKEAGLYTIGKFAGIRAKWRINNMNWNSPIDYYPIENKKLIAVIGDSFIESMEVNVGESYPFLLREKLKNDYEVYAFGKAGSPLSQYLHVSRYVNNHFNPDIIIFNIVHNDFIESIQELYPNRNYFLQLSINEHDSIKETIPKPDYSSPQYKPLMRLIYNSALFRYLYLNLHANEIRKNIFNPKNIEYESNTDVNEFKKNRDLIIKASSYIVKTIREENLDKKIIFIMDAPRESIYNNTLDKSNTIWLNEILGTICTNNNIEFIDLTNDMKINYTEKKIKFNSDLDEHWNEYSHKFIADILYRYLNNIN